MRSSPMANSTVHNSTLRDSEISFTAHCEAGQITLEYVLLLAAVVLPLVGVVYMLWEILMYFFWNTALVVSMPYL